MLRRSSITTHALGFVISCALRSKFRILFVVILLMRIILESLFEIFKAIVAQSSLLKKVILADRDRRLHQFGAICAAQSPPVKHVLRPVELKEALAENWFREHFRAANSMLWEARLSPIFWADAVQYSQFLFNRSPNSHVGDHTTPFEIVTRHKPRWDKFKVFGCDAFQQIPNNPYYKYPGIPRGRRRSGDLIGGASGARAARAQGQGNERPRRSPTDKQPQRPPR